MQKRMAVLAALVLAAGFAAAVVAQEASDDEEAVKAIGGQWQDAWNGGDIDAIGALYAGDSDYVNLFGEWFKGREQIQASFSEIHSTAYKGAEISIETTSIQFIEPDVAVSDSVWEMTGLPEGTEAPSKGQSTAVMVKKEGDWKIVAHRARVPAPPLTPPE
jgi:uncharacterized protein (TIGR02246 family)